MEPATETDIVLQNSARHSPPPRNAEWTENMRKWPSVTDMNIFSYLVERQGCDLKQIKAYKSTTAYNYFLSECVGNISIHEHGQKIYLKAQVRPSQSVHTSYSCWVLTEKDGTILTGSCACKAGNSTVCSHVAAVLYKVSYAQARGFCGETCTDIQQKWNAGTSKNVVPSTIRTTNFKRPKQGSSLEEYSAVSPSTPAVKQRRFDSTVELFEYFQTGDLKDICKIPGTLLHSVLTTPALDKGHFDQTNSTDEIDVRLEPHGDHYNAETLACQPCRAIYERLLKGTPEGYKRLAVSTMYQSAAPDTAAASLWKISRKLRITASSASNVPKRLATDPRTFLNNHVFGKFKGNAHTLRGNCGEEEARKRYENMTKSKIEITGTCVSSKLPWLSASPDGILGDSIVEIKCPDPEKFQTYLNRTSYDVFLNSNGNYDLRRNKAYYMQVQLCMFCLNKKNCIFILYLGHQKELIDFNVPFDADFVTQNINRLEDFYFKNMLPYISDKIQSKTLIVPQEYESIINI